jgi:mannose-6-phosphate isomerase-like protein (cupin superfamily)
VSSTPEAELVRRPSTEDGRTYWFLHNLSTVVAAGPETGGRVGIVEMTGPRGDMPPLHVHHEEDELFVVLEGTLSVWVGGRQARVDTGETAFAPMGVPHVYRVESERARWLAVVTPSRFDRFVEEVGIPAETIDLPPASMPLPDPDWLEERASAYGIEILGPPGTLPS